MKVLLYTEQTIGLIAAAKDMDFATVKNTHMRAKQLGMEIYSVIDFIHFRTLKENPYATYIDSSFVDKFYEFLEPESLSGYSEVQPIKLKGVTTFR